MVKALHAAGIEVILDVVFNHTVEGNETGPTLSLRGLDNAAYYKLEADESASLRRIAPAPATRLRSVMPPRAIWSSTACATGSRKCTSTASASISPRCSGRDNGRSAPTRAFFKAVAAEPSLRYVKLIAEPWDVGPDGYQLGHFPAGWSEWNDLYRDTMRGFWRGNPGILGNFAERFAGSSDLFRASGRRPTASINYVACHDGFTLYDATAYEREAQRSESRRQPRRPQSQPELELRRRRADRRSGGDRAARTADSQSARDVAAVAGRADAAGRRRVRPHAARQQQCLLPGQRDQLGRLGARRAPQLADGVRPATAHIAPVCRRACGATPS